MKRLIITTIILLIATVLVTVVYFKNLNTPAQNTSRVMNTIPADAAFVFEFNNDATFYDIFKGNSLFTCLIGKQAISDLDNLRNQLLLNPLLNQFFNAQNIFISIHPLKNNNIALLLTIAASKGFNQNILDELVKQKNNGLLIRALDGANKKGFIIYSSILKKRFYVVSTSDDIFLGSFSKDLVLQCANYKPQKNAMPFVLMPDQQNASSLGSLYVNYAAITPLFNQLFQNKNIDLFKSLRLFTGMSSLSLNFNSDALIFNGETDIEKNRQVSYLNLFINQQPFINRLTDIFPSTTAYSVSFAVSNPLAFKLALSQFQVKTGLQIEKDELFKKIKTETGINVINEFNNLMGNEFAVVTTRYQEKLAIIGVKDGTKLKSLMYNLGTIVTEKTGRLNYDKVPYFLLGDAFIDFKRPFFMIVDNYLILANSTNELASYADVYTNRKFLNKTAQYSRFDNLLAQKSNVAYFVNFKNIAPLLKTDLTPHFDEIFEQSTPGISSFYGASYQFSASGKGFFTNFSIQLTQPDTLNIKTRDK